MKAGLDPGWQGDPITPQNATMRINLLNVTNVITRPDKVTDIIIISVHTCHAALSPGITLTFFISHELASLHSRSDAKGIPRLSDLMHLEYVVN